MLLSLSFLLPLFLKINNKKQFKIAQQTKEKTLLCKKKKKAIEKWQAKNEKNLSRTHMTN